MLDFPQAAARRWRKSQLLGIENFSGTGLSGVLGGVSGSGERQGVLEGRLGHLEERMVVSDQTSLTLTLSHSHTYTNRLLP